MSLYNTLIQKTGQKQERLAPTPSTLYPDGLR